MNQAKRNTHHFLSLLLAFSFLLVSTSTWAQPPRAARGHVQVPGHAQAPKHRWFQIWRRAPKARAITPAQAQAKTTSLSSRSMAKPTASKAAGGHERLTLRATWGRLRDEFQLYRGDRLERLANHFAVGRSNFDPKLTVGQNLEAEVKHFNANHKPGERIAGEWKDIGGRRVYAVTVELDQGKRTRTILRTLYNRVERQTIELNYKAATSKNPTGHVAVRVGSGATYDLTGANAASTLPRFLAGLLQRVRGTTDMSFGRRRSLRRFMESRRDWSNKTASVFYGFLFSASKNEQDATARRYKGRLGLSGGETLQAGDPQPMKKFSISGGNAKEGVYSCAQVLTEKVPFINDRGMRSTIGAKTMVGDAVHSKQLDGVIIYKMPSTDAKTLSQKNPW